MSVMMAESHHSLVKPEIDIKDESGALIDSERASPDSPFMPPQSSASAPTAARRPPRKSTLTQQQKNQKRQRATQEQLSTLEIEFNKNPTPTAAVREQIARDINMTERSVQIWFQNRRAKIKNLAKKSIETGEDCDAIPESMRKYLAMQALESGKPLVRDMMNPCGMPSFGGLIMNADSAASKVLISHLACRSLTIGTWRRISQTALDLVVFYSPAKSMMTYYINAESSGFKIEYPFSIIKNITLDSGDMSHGAEGAAQRQGGLIVELTQPPTFSMDPGSGGWFQCRDFTEDQQASHVFIHHLGGHPKVLSGQLAKLVSLESFRNRHRSPDQMNQAVSAPVSPVGGRPSSQPNHMVHPHSQIQMYQDPSAFMMGPPAPRGHKRQRSRSVPAAIDYSQLRQPMAPFLMQQPELPPHIIHHHHHIFAPVPQHAQAFVPHGSEANFMPLPHMAHAPLAPHQVPQPPMSAPPGPQMQQQQQQQQPQHQNAQGLSIDTTQGFNLDIHQAPMSATTATSSNEFDQQFFTTGPPSDTFSSTNLNTPYQATFLSPMVDPSSVGTHPASPLSSMSHGDPVIANQSPPLNGMDRSASADFISATHDGHQFTEDSFNFNEMYGKQGFQLPFRSPLVEAPVEDFDFQSMIHFGNVDSASLSPENSGFATTA